MKKQIIELLQISNVSYYRWRKAPKNKGETNPPKIFDLLDKYFTKEELEEFLETGAIARLDTLEGLSVEDVQLLKDLKEVLNRRGNQ